MRYHGDVNLRQPLLDVIPGARGAVLATLAQLSVPVTVRALARHAGVSAQGALSVVNELAAAGLVEVEPAGPSLMVVLNRAHLAAEPLATLTSLRARLVERLTDTLSGWDDLAGAWLFGSAARGDGARDSDIDLLLVTTGSRDRQSWVERVGELADQVRRWTGNQAQIVEHTRRSFATLARAANPLVAALRTDGIPLTPKTRQLLRRVA
jgi:predicted nucleotidyltransferase